MRALSQWRCHCCVMACTNKRPCETSGACCRRWAGWCVLLLCAALSPVTDPCPRCGAAGATSGRPDGPLPLPLPEQGTGTISIDLAGPIRFTLRPERLRRGLGTPYHPRALATADTGGCWSTMWGLGDPAVGRRFFRRWTRGLGFLPMHHKGLGASPCGLLGTGRKSGRQTFSGKTRHGKLFPKILRNAPFDSASKDKPKRPSSP